MKASLLMLLLVPGILACSSESREGERVRTMTDPRDEQLYPTIGSAGKIWLARNLDFTTPISWCRNDLHEECAEYGRLYSWEDAKTVCPAGWHLPTEAEWHAILDDTGDPRQAYTEATTGSFAITMGGSRTPEGQYSDSDGMYWTSSSCGADSAAIIAFDEDSSRVARRCNPAQGWAMSVRCVRELNGAARDTMEARLAEATRAFKSAPNDADSIIWLGRRTAYLGRFNEAIEIYTRSIALHPNDARMYRHRGHRYITTRQFDKAIADFEKAYELTRGKPDQVEPDGLPNARNIPTSTLKSNIRYHLGLAHYLRGDFDKAARLYAEDVAAAANPDMHVASAHWLYMSYRRRGRLKEAEAVLAPVSSKMEVIENTAYHRLLLMYKGELEPSDVLPEQKTSSLENVTTAYGVANWHLYNGRKEEARKLFEQIVATKAQWASFGYLAAEAELARIRRGIADFLIAANER